MFFTKKRRKVPEFIRGEYVTKSMHNTYQKTANQVSSILKNMGKGTQDIANALKSLGKNADQISSA